MAAKNLHLHFMQKFQNSLSFEIFSMKSLMILIRDYQGISQK